MKTITFSSSTKKASETKASTLVIYVAQSEAKGSKKQNPRLEGVSAKVKSWIEDKHKKELFSGSKGESYFGRDAGLGEGDHILLVGVGNCSNDDHEALRKASAQAYKALQGQRIEKATLSMPNLSAIWQDAYVTGRAVAEGFELASYSVDHCKSNDKAGSKKKKQLKSVEIAQVKEAASDLKKGLNHGAIIAESTNFSRYLGDMPGNLMTPTILAREVQKAASGTGLKVTVWDKARLKKEKMGALLGVAAGSSEDPRLIIMEYKGAGQSKAPVCYVGKGLTFDSGGISIKPSSGMEEMKYDMCGGANVIGAVLALAKMKAKANVLGIVPASENMPGPAANKPGDVLTARNGKTIEVNNTDAEGRLILADALVYASERKPKVIFDAATLTGAMVVALGNIHTGFYTRDAKLRQQVERAAELSGEKVWAMPLVDDHSDDMKGTFADLSNLASNRGAGSATAAAFLENFVDKKIPWAHFDIAGTGWNASNRLPYCPSKGATGAVVRTFVELGIMMG